MVGACFKPSVNQIKLTANNVKFEVHKVSVHKERWFFIESPYLTNSLNGFFQ